MTMLDQGVTRSPANSGDCPVDHGRDERKTAAVATKNIKPDVPDAVVVTDFKFARDILRNPTMRQFMADTGLDLSNPDQVSFFFLDGEIHRQKRSQVARYFAPKAIEQRYQPVMNRVMDRLIGDLRQSGREQLDLMSFELAVEVAAEVVGLTDSNPKHLAQRIRLNFTAMSKRTDGFFRKNLAKANQAYRALNFLYRDVKPAIRSRKVNPRDDVISHLVEVGYPDQAILIECMTYATAGMLTTREFIVIATWYLFDRPGLRKEFLEGNETDQLAILYEVLRMEPVAGMIHRRATEDWTGSNGEQVKAGTIYAIDIRAVNTDEAAAGACPLTFDQGRAKRMKTPPMWMSFSEGAHRCPGNQVALHETRVFLDRLFRVPGIRLTRAPNVAWFGAVKGYELHGAIVECDLA